MDEVIEQRIITHLGLAKAVAIRTVDARCGGADRDDLLAWGVVGLVQAAQRFKADQGAPFGAYAARRVRGQVLDALRARDPLSRTARRRYREERAVNEDLPQPYSEVSLEKLLEAGHEPGKGPDAPPSPPDARWPKVVAALRGLPAAERRAIALSFGRSMTLREVGALLGLSESGACRLRTRALAHLREAMDAPDLIDAA